MALGQHSPRNVGVIAVVLAAWVSTAAAQTGQEKAKAQFERAQSAYQAGDYRAAIGALEVAYLEDPQPIFLFNIGRCYRELGENADAARSFRSYLEKVPEDPNRAEIEASIRDLEKPRRAPAVAMPASESGKPPGLDLTTRPTPVRPLYKRGWFWTAIGVVVVAAAAGTVLVMRRSPACPGGFKCVEAR